ncbi:hypothetical protein [Sulfurimonas sp.]|uniref:hypothetical protein n=1 Tax=Sulfurimonas sp. TaxID=2022749 RepID=UPI0025D21DE5|nr:hypothetical protein [Sulfurimonas sp.]
MAKSATFSVLKATAHSSAHNSREDMPDYLIGFKDGNENSYDLRHSDSDFLELAKVKYQEVTGQKMQQKQIDALIKETVLTLEDHHTEADVQKVFDTLNKRYGGHYITELSIHKDEGHFEDKNGITYYPTKDILQKEDGWYIVPLAESLEMKPSYKPKKHEFNEQVEINDFKPIHNIHAHVKFSMFDLETGKTGRMKHNELNDRIKTAAHILKLEYNPEKAIKKRTPVEQIKTQHKAVRNEKIKALEKGLKSEQSIGEQYSSLPIRERLKMREEMKEIVGDSIETDTLSKRLEVSEKENKSLKEEIQALKEAQKEERSQLKEQGATRADYAQMEAKYKELTAQLKEAKSADVPKADTVEELLKIVEELEKPIYAPTGEKELIKKDANGREIDPIDELVKASYKRIEEKTLFTTETKNVFDKDIFIQKVKERENEHQKLHQEKNGIIKALKAIKERAETALKSVLSKFTGKSISEVQKERTELLKAQKEQERLEHQKEKNRGGIER